MHILFLYAHRSHDFNAQQQRTTTELDIGSTVGEYIISSEARILRRVRSQTVTASNSATTTGQLMTISSSNNSNSATTTKSMQQANAITIAPVSGQTTAGSGNVVITSNLQHRPPNVISASAINTAIASSTVSTNPPTGYTLVSSTPNNSQVVSVCIKPEQLQQHHQQQQQQQQLQQHIQPQTQTIQLQQPQSYQIIFAPANATTATVSSKQHQDLLAGSQIEWVSSAPPPLKKYATTTSSSSSSQQTLKKLNELHSSEPTTLEAPQAYPVVLTSVKALPEPQSICVLKSAAQQQQQQHSDGSVSTGQTDGQSALLSSLPSSMKIVKHMTTTKGSTISLPITLPMGTTYGSTTITLPMSTTITQKRIVASGGTGGNVNSIGGEKTIRLVPQQQQQQQQTQQQQQQLQQQQPQHTTFTIEQVRTLKFAEMDDIELPDGTKIGYATGGADDEDDDEEEDDDQQHQDDQHIITELKVENSSVVNTGTATVVATSGAGGETTLAQKYSIIAASAVASTDAAEHLSADVTNATVVTGNATIDTSNATNVDQSTLSGGEDGGNTSGTGGTPVGGHSYACRHCGKRYRWKSTLRRHENDECGGKEPAHQCPYCSYKAKQRGNLGVHVRKHHGDQPQLESRRKKRSLEATLELAEEMMSA